jgi:hypothetical protein
MNSDAREFLKSRRAKVTPEMVGITTSGGFRRVPGLRREEVAMLAAISVDYYNRCERGDLSGVSENILESLARALRLDDAERAHLFDLARAANKTPPRVRRPRPQKLRSSVQQLLDGMTEIPAFVQNGRLDVLGMNALAHAFITQTTMHRINPRTSLDTSFSTMKLPRRSRIGEGWRKTSSLSCDRKRVGTLTTGTSRTSSASSQQRANSSALCGRIIMFGSIEPASKLSIIQSLAFSNCLSKQCNCRETMA